MRGQFFFKSNIFLIYMVASMCVLPQWASAHDTDYAVLRTDLVVQDAQIELRLSVPKEVSIKAAGGGEREHILTEYFSDFFSITQDGAPCVLGEVSSEILGPRETTFATAYTCPHVVTNVESLHIRNALFSDLFQNFNNYTSLSIGGNEWTLVFSAVSQDYPDAVTALQGVADIPTVGQFPATTSATTTANQVSNPVPNPTSTVTDAVASDTVWARFLVVAKQFFVSGVEHIWTGYDHLLFLVGVVLLQRSKKKLLLLVTSFTIAHSVTFLLAGLRVITLSPSIVEPLIALTVGYLAIENFISLKRQREFAARVPQWAVTFCFGLIHGLGFAGTLVETNIPQAFYIPALVMFNLGIEAGQIAFLGVTLVVLLRLDVLKKRREIFMGVSVVVALLSLYWFLERILS